MFEEEDRFNEEEDFEPSIQRYEQMLKYNERYFFDVEEVEVIADHYLDEGNLNNAINALDFGLSLHPKSSDLLLKKAQLLASIGKLKAAHSLLDQVVSLDGEMEEIYITRANLYSQEHKHDKAIEYFQRALDVTEEFKEEILMDLSFEYQNIEDYNSAIDCLKNILQENPENEAALYEISYCYGQLNLNEENAEFLNTFIEKNPYSFTAWYNLGNAYHSLGLHENAVQSYEYCALIEPTFSSAYFNAANSHVALGNFQRAIELYEKTFEFETPQATTHNYIGECYEKLQQFDKAEEHFRKALEIDNNFPEAWIGLAIAKDNLGQQKEAVGLIEQAISIDSENSDYWYIYAESLEKNNRIEEANIAYEKAIEISPKNVILLLDASEFLVRNYSIEEAIELFKTHSLGDQKIFYRLAALNLKIGKIQDALNFLEASLKHKEQNLHLLTEYYPEALQFEQVVELINQYKI